MSFQFGHFLLDEERYELRRCGEKLALEPRVLELLVHLVRHRQRVVPKEELLKEVWEGKFVTESVLTRAVAQARKALGAPDWITTVYGRGYRFAGEVETEEEKRPVGDSPPSSEAAAGMRPLSAPTPRLPPVALTSWVGREDELSLLLDLVRRRRLVTLTGPGGSGKTRLAVEAVHRLAGERTDEDPRDEVLFVSLAETRDVDGVPGVVARALGLRDVPGRRLPDLFAETLRDRRLLLVLDNFEQVAGAASFVSRLLRVCPGVTILVTSRFVLGIEGEQELPVPPLPVPPEGVPEADLARAPAVALFLERARAARPDFDPTGSDLQDVAHICRALDGLPLALELAAPLVKLFSPPELRRRLSERLDLLVSGAPERPSRHRTLERALAWSYELLEDDEAAFFRRLSVFAGGFTPAVAAEVAQSVEPVPGSEPAIARIRSLMDKSLVVRRPGPASQARFGLLETTRELARCRLREAGEEAAAVAAHARSYRRLAEQAEPALAGGDQARWLARLDAEHDNLAVAMDGAAAAGRPETALAIGAATWRYASARGLYREAYERLRGLLERPEAKGVESRLRSRALTGLGGLAHLLCDLRGSARYLEEARELWEGLGDRKGIAEVLGHLGWIEAQLGNLRRAADLSQRALALYRELEDARGRAVAWNNLAWVAQYGGSWEGAAERFGRSFEARRSSGDDRGAAFAQVLRAQALSFLGRLREAEQDQSAAAAEAERLGDRPLEAFALLVAGLLALRRDRPEEADDLLRRSVTVWREVGQLAGVAWALTCQGEAKISLGRLDEAREMLDESIEIARDIGAAWDLAQALERRAELARREGAEAEARELETEATAIHARLRDGVAEADP